MTRVKICGLKRWQDIEAAIESGADALGFVMEPSSPRYIGEDDAVLEQLEIVPVLISTVAVFGIARPIPFFDYFHAVQAIDFSGVPDEELPLHAIKVLRTIPREGQTGYGPDLAVLLDADDPTSYGGTGKKVDWDLAAEFVRLTDARVFLAGGLTPDNVAEAIRTVRPYAVDVSSGVEVSPGVKDPIKIRDFIQAAKGALPD